MSGIYTAYGILKKSLLHLILESKGEKMTTETKQAKVIQKRCMNVQYHTNSGDAVYGLVLIGAAIFCVGQATTFWMGVLGLLKAFVWPVFLVLEARSL